ncbi:serine/threonine protein kinase [Streptomyces sp. TSRI0445]|uniref:non-specific serine/threonine protein kinase n=1 Tax=Streptomyces globisporus TaxID=1908 RepID=A0ABM9H6L1_STRGL|nr:MULTISPECIES: serine/threonine-protein kinase [Streptomyces]RAN21010.1 serine/threonine protein kinase [Streptomyces badius]OKI65443.1 serine/threonine protein kinase [Streptomyces sp. TSRI0445]RAN28942.1 serine/threonine protein kinase [Streptomyces badius]UIZ11353.1 protein kinase [Streptomyces sp. R527F]CAH9419287.1 Putative serine/threonine protein kinase [Streptomyces globisporus]
MGEVWRATDEVLGRAVAVKLLLGDQVDASSTARFRLEAQTAARLSHPHLVAVFDFGAWEDRFFLVMELVEGQSLGDLLAAQERVHPELVARIAGQAAAGLAAAHRQGIVHRDIKPGNLMLDADGSVKIGDFGIAQFVDDPSTALTTAGHIVGTSLYLAPERALGRTADSASDMYSLGCVVYQLLLGQPPFRSDTATATLYQHVDTPPVPLRQRGVEISAAFDSYLLGLLAKQPEERPTAQQVSDWFRTDAWRGRPEPLPMQAPTSHRATAPMPPKPSPAAPPAPVGPTTYRLPGPTGRRRQAPARSAPARRRSTREAIRRRPRVASAIAGTATFLAAVYLGMILFSPDSSSAGTPDQSPSSAPVAPSAPSQDGDGGAQPQGDQQPDGQQHGDRQQDGQRQGADRGEDGDRDRSRGGEDEQDD